MIKVAVCGANGRMGKEVCQTVIDNPYTELAAKIDINGSDVYSSIKQASESVKIDVLVDFTQPDSIFENAKFCINNDIKIVIGTTGLSDSQIQELK